MSGSSLKGRNFDQRPVVEALEVLAAETFELALIARRFDQIIPELIEQLHDPSAAVSQEFQNIDMLHQYLVETSQALFRMVKLVDPETLIDAEALSSPSRLEYFRTRLRGGNNPSITEINTKSIQLF